ncbi:hypothetical protein Tco_1355180 [Tanacetum coccineum]
MAKPILDEARAEQNLAEPRTESNAKLELSKELLKELRDYAYNKRVEEDVIGFPSLTCRGFKKMVDGRRNWENPHLGGKVKKCFEDGNNNGLINDVASCDEEWEESDYGNPANADIDSPVPCLNDDGKNKKRRGNGYELKGNIPNNAPHFDNNNEQLDEKMCKVEKFKVIKYSIGDSEEFLAICTHECNSWAQIVNGLSSIYHDIFCKKDDGWTGHRTK